MNYTTWCDVMEEFPLKAVYLHSYSKSKVAHPLYVLLATVCASLQLYVPVYCA